MSSEQLKTAAVMGSYQNNPAQSDPIIDSMLTSMMLADTDVNRILKGEIHEPLNLFRQSNADLRALIIDCFKLQSIDKEQGLEILFQLQESEKLMVKIELQLTRYYHMVPYLLMTAPLNQLSNIDQKKADAYCRRVGLMIGRDKLMSSWDENSYETQNFYDGLQMVIELRLYGSVNGWKMRAIVEERKQVITEIHDRTGSQRKKRFGLF